MTLNGVTYAIPAEGDSNWGTVLANYFIALSTGVLQKAGGTFTLTADADFGATYGLKTAYLKSRATNPSATGIVRLGNTEGVSWRNAANGADIALSVNASDQLTYNGVVLASTTGPSFQDSLFNIFDNSDNTKKIAFQASGITTATTRTITMPDSNVDLGALVNANISASAAIAVSKLAALTASKAAALDSSGFLVAATATAAELDYLSGVTSAVQTQLNAKATSASPTFSGTITTPLTASRAMVTGASSELAVSATTATELGYVSGVTSAIQTQINTKAPAASPTFTGTITTPLTASRAVVTGASSELASSAATGTEVGYLSGVTSAIQTQLDSKVAKTLTTTTGDMIYASSANTPARLAIGSSNQLLKVVGGIPAWSAAPSGGVNYLSAANDGDAIGVWTTYADAAASSPVDGTGGSPGITYAVSTNSDLRSTSNFLFTHDNADRQGEGFSYAFTIDAADKYSVLQCSFDYLVASGAYADDDLQFWVYDVTNATLIQPAPYKLKNASIAQKFAFEFQATSSTSYRLIAHVATITATAYTLRFDNWNLGPQAKLYGSPVTDWTSFTSTLKGGTNGSTFTNQTTTAYYRRVGDSLEVQLYTAFSGTPGTGTGAFIWTLPSGLTIDTSKNSLTINNSVIGSAHALDSGTAYREGNVVYWTTTAVAIESGAGTDNWNLTTPHTWTTSDVISLVYKVPITGWSSSVIMSSDAATNVVGFRAYLASTTSFNNTTVIYDTEMFDKTGSYSVSTGIFSAPTPGLYYAHAQGFSSTTTVGIVLLKNGTSIARSYQISTANDDYANVSALVELNAGDTLKVNTDSNQSLYGGTSDNYFEVFKISGPASIAASETVNVYQRTATPTGTINNTENTVVFGSVTRDTHGAYNTSTGIFTVPISGTYACEAGAEIQITSATAGQVVTVYWKLDSAHQSTPGVITLPVTTGTVSVFPTANATFRALAGQQIKLVSYSSATGPVWGGALFQSSFSITRVGNY